MMQAKDIKVGMQLVGAETTVSSSSWHDLSGWLVEVLATDQPIRYYASSGFDGRGGGQRAADNGVRVRILRTGGNTRGDIGREMTLRPTQLKGCAAAWTAHWDVEEPKHDAERTEYHRQMRLAEQLNGQLARLGIETCISSDGYRGGVQREVRLEVQADQMQALVATLNLMDAEAVG